MPPTTPYAGKFSSYTTNNNNRPQPHSPYHTSPGQNPTKDNIYNNAYRSAENPYDAPQPHSSYRSTSVSSVTAKERHHSSGYPASENPYCSPQPRSPRQHSISCPARVYRHSSSSGSSEQPCRNNSVTAKSRFYGHAISTSYGEMCYHDNSLVSASLEALIQHLVPTVDYYPDVRKPGVNVLNVLFLCSIVPLTAVFMSSSEVVRVHLPAELPPLPAPLRAHDQGVSPVCGAAAVGRRPPG